MNKIEKDVRKIGVPNVNFSLTDEDDPREEEFSQQRRERGFDDSETWDLGASIMQFSIPRLEAFVLLAGKNIDDDELIDAAKSILRSFELMTRDNGSRIFSKAEKMEVDAGLALLPLYLPRLGW